MNEISFQLQVELNNFNVDVEIVSICISNDISPIKTLGRVFVCEIPFHQG